MSTDALELLGSKSGGAAETLKNLGLQPSVVEQQIKTVEQYVEKDPAALLYLEIMRISGLYLEELEKDEARALVGMDEFEIHEAEAKLRAVRELVGLFTYLNKNETVHQQMSPFQRLNNAIEGLSRKQ
jgi:hypothetical protein